MSDLHGLGAEEHTYAEAREKAAKLLAALKRLCAHLPDEEDMQSAGGPDDEIEAAVAVFDDAADAIAAYERTTKS